VRRLAPTLLALVLLAASPAARAGTEEDPDVPGVRDHSDPTLDFLGAWLENAPGGVVFTVKVATLPKAPLDRYYAVSFGLAGARTVAIVGFDDKGRPHSDLRAPDFERQGVRGAEAFSEALRHVEVTPGSPGYVSAFVPFGATAGFAPGKVLVDLYGGTGTYNRQARDWSDVDGRSTTNAFVLEETYVPLVVQRNPAAFVAASVVLLAAAGGAVAWWIHRRASRRAPPP
jgi:hypothetical protein